MKTVKKPKKELIITTIPINQEPPLIAPKDAFKELIERPERVTLEFNFSNGVGGYITIDYTKEALVTALYLISGAGCKLTTHYMGGKK